MLAEVARHIQLVAINAPLGQSIGRWFRRTAARLDAADWLTALVLLAGLTLGVWALLRLAAQQQRLKRSNHPGRLFQSLCKTHGLDRREARLLTRLVAHHQLAHPGLLFVDHRYFGDERLDAGLTGKAEQLLALRDALFAGVALANEDAAQQEAAHSI